jgi:hypothetical protein
LFLVVLVIFFEIACGNGNSSQLPFKGDYFGTSREALNRAIALPQWLSHSAKKSKETSPVVASFFYQQPTCRLTIHALRTILCFCACLSSLSLPAGCAMSWRISKSRYAKSSLLHDTR